MTELLDDVTQPAGDDDGPRRRRIAPLIVGVVAIVMVGLFVVLAGADADRSESADSPLIGRPAPEATGTLDDGTSFDLARRKGSWVVLNFFDPECVPCIQEHPELVQFSEDQASLGVEGAELYSVITRGEQGEIDAFFDENGGDWPAIYSEVRRVPRGVRGRGGARDVDHRSEWCGAAAPDLEGDGGPAQPDPAAVPGAVRRMTSDLNRTAQAVARLGAAGPRDRRVSRRRGDAILGSGEPGGPDRRASPDASPARSATARACSSRRTARRRRSATRSASSSPRTI